VAQAFDLDGRYLILNGGGQNPPPRAVVDALTRYERQAAVQPRPNNDALVARLDDVRRRLASHLGCDAGEVAITRNTTEGLNTVVWGLDIAPGDEVLVSSFDQHYAGIALRARAARHGLVVREVALPVTRASGPSDDEVVAHFRAALTPRTRLLVASHVADGWGFVLPIRRLADLAHAHGAQLLADGALSFGHTPVDVRALGCDYYVSSLHKWLGAPLGTGLLYVRRDRVPALWPLYGSDVADRGDVRKYEDVGTRAGAPLAAIGQALDFHELVGPARKAARLRFLLDHAVARLAGVPGVRTYTDAERRGGLARVAVDGVKGPALARALRERHGIWVYAGFDDAWGGTYVSPNLFNTPAHLDAFADAVRAVARAARSGAPA